MQLSSSKTTDAAKVERDLRFLVRCFQEVLQENGEQALAAALPWGDAAADSPPHAPAPDAVKLTQAFSIAFQLLNIVEENALMLTDPDVMQLYAAHQVARLRKWRRAGSPATLTELLPTVNAIANGLGTTG